MFAPTVLRRRRLGLSNLAGDMAKIVVGVLLGLGVVGVSIVLVLGVSRLPEVRWGAIGAALRGDPAHDLADAIQAKSRVATQRHQPASQPRAAAAMPAKPAAALPPVASDPVRADAESLIPPPSPGFVLKMPALPAVAMRAPDPVAPAKPAEDSRAPDAGVDVRILPGPAVQPAIASAHPNGVLVNLLPRHAPASPPLAAASTSASTAPPAPAWSVVTVLPESIVVRRGSVMQTIGVGSSLPDGRILQSVDPSRGTWAAASQAPKASSSQPQQEHHHGSTALSGIPPVASATR